MAYIDELDSFRVEILTYDGTIWKNYLAKDSSPKNIGEIKIDFHEGKLYLLANPFLGENLPLKLYSVNANSNLDIIGFNALTDSGVLNTDVAFYENYVYVSYNSQTGSNNCNVKKLILYNNLSITIAERSSLQLYPNPTTNKINFSNNKKCTYRIIDIYGQEITKGIFSKINNFSDSYEFKKSGVYILQTPSECKNILVQ